jgi:hypothetical protein
MTVIEITRPAKCKDCKHFKRHPLLKRAHICANENSPQKKYVVRLNDLVCDKWELI